jgi:dCMP deaminase
MAKDWIPPRDVPDRDSKYMGMAWMWAGFSKDPNTQVGAQLVSSDNRPLGSGYNGPAKRIDDRSFSWCRPSKDDPDLFSKNDIVIHAEINAIDHSFGEDLNNATLYCTAYPCKECMKDIVKTDISRIVFFDYKSDSGSTLRKKDKKKAEKIAGLAGIHVEKFSGNLHWVKDWAMMMQNMGVFEM